MKFIVCRETDGNWEHGKEPPCVGAHKESVSWGGITTEDEWIVEFNTLEELMIFILKTGHNIELGKSRHKDYEGLFHIKDLEYQREMVKHLKSGTM